MIVARGVLKRAGQRPARFFVAASAVASRHAHCLLGGAPREQALVVVVAVRVVAKHDAPVGGVVELQLRELDVVWQDGAVRRECAPLVPTAGGHEEEGDDGLEDCAAGLDDGVEDGRQFCLLERAGNGLIGVGGDVSMVPSSMPSRGARWQTSSIVSRTSEPLSVRSR